MKNYNFIQRYRYDDDWNGELIDIPNNAIFYNVSNINETQQEWYIIIPDKHKYINPENDEDIDNLFQGEGCCQVITYELLDYLIINLSNIIPIGKWDSVTEDFIIKLFEDKFYINEYKRSEYKINYDNIGEDVFIKVKDEVLLSASKITNLLSEGRVEVKMVNLKNRYTEKDAKGVDITNYRLCDIILNLSEYIRLETTTDSKLYNESLDEVIKIYK